MNKFFHFKNKENKIDFRIIVLSSQINSYFSVFWAMGKNGLQEIRCNRWQDTITLNSWGWFSGGFVEGKKNVKRSSGRSIGASYAIESFKIQIIISNNVRNKGDWISCGITLITWFEFNREIEFERIWLSSFFLLPFFRGMYSSHVIPFLRHLEQGRSKLNNNKIQYRIEIDLLSSQEICDLWHAVHAFVILLFSIGFSMLFWLCSIFKIMIFSFSKGTFGCISANYVARNSTQQEQKKPKIYFNLYLLLLNKSFK